jgi:S-formylglutathione hydrolase FrmB/acetyl esterase/lipase
VQLKSQLIAGLLGITACGVALAQAPQASAQDPPPPAAGRGAQAAAPQRGGRGGRQGGPEGAPNEGRGQGGPALKIERDLEYSRAGGVALTLDLYHVDPVGSASPVVVWIHGMDVPLTTKAATPAAGLVSAGNGLAVASIEYRTASGTTLATQLADAKAAVRWLRDHAAAYNLDPAHIAAFGYGVGGQIAALLGTTADVGALEGGTATAPSSRVQAFIDVAGPVTTGGMNPTTYVTKDSAPGLIIHGTADTTVSTRESQALISALKVAGVNATLDMQIGVTHDLGALLSPVPMQRVSSFLAQHLQGAAGNTALSVFIATPAETYIDPIGLDLGGTQYRLYPTPSRGANMFASYRVYLPPDYQTNARRRYPVIYFLHGRSVDSKRPITSGYITRVDAAIRSGVMPPVIVVLAQGLTTGWYVDAQDGKHPMESVIVKDLVAHVDATYRTIATREARAIEGHSMGGFGALHIGFKYPDLFAAVTGDSPALVENVTDGVGDQAFWVAQAPATLAKINIDKVRKQAIRIIVGDQDGLFPVGKKLDETLTELNIQHEFFPVAGSPHNHDQLLQYETFDTMAFYGRAFGKVAGK